MTQPILKWDMLMNHLSRKIRISKKCSFEYGGNGEDLLAKIVELEDR